MSFKRHTWKNYYKDGEAQIKAQVKPRHNIKDFVVFP